MENILIVPTPNWLTGVAVLRGLDPLGAAWIIELRGAALVDRSADGRWYIPGETEHASYRGTLTGGALGVLISLLAGPAGQLLGGAAGLPVGAWAELGDAEHAETIVHALGRLIPPGTTAVVCDVFETASEAVDRALACLGLDRWRIRCDEAKAQLDTALYRDRSRCFM